MITLVLGGARSGKSRFAESLAERNNPDVVYIATAQAQDGEMQKRIVQHQQQRPNTWQTVEEPLALAHVIERYSQANNVILVDCLTLWLSNLLCLDDETRLQQEKEQLISCFSTIKGQLILVSNEVGLGIIPMGELSRRYVDEAGHLHQAIAAQADNVVLVTAGLPQVLKGNMA